MKYTYSIKQNYEFRRLYRRGKSAASPYMVIYRMKNRRPYNRIGLTVSPKIGGAVVRNRIKRLFREGYRLHEMGIAKGFDFVIVARARMAQADYQRTQKEMIRLIGRLETAEKGCEKK